MPAHIVAENLGKFYRIPEREAGVTEAVKSLLRPKYREVKAVDGISFSIEKGERVGFIGPNGAGKTTTLKMLSGLLHPTEGAATAAGFVPWERRNAYLRRISMLMGNRSQMTWNNTVRDSFLVFRDIYGVPKEDFEKNAAGLCELLEAGHLLKKQARNLSLGERAKCELIAALLHRPEILYLDEPTLGMDVSMQLRIREYIRGYNEATGATVMLTSHYMADITSLCPRVLLIHRGKLLYDGRLAELADKLSPFRLIELTPEAGSAINETSLRGIPVRIAERDEHRVTLRVGKDDAVPAIGALMERFALRDLSVQTPPIEAVIDQIYAEGVVA